MPHDGRLTLADWTLRDRLLLALATVAAVAGTIARFKGLGATPLGADEYYTVQSVQNILRSGLPEYACGGFYERSILLQYLAAGLQLLGMSPELATRSISAVSGLAALPAGWLLARRLGGRTAGLLAVALLSVSVWEVEMSRLGRMYTPYQAVFLWHLVFLVRYTVDRQRRALGGMVAMTLLGMLVWEGGVLQAALNLLPPFLNHDRGRLSRRQWLYLAGIGALFLVIYAYWQVTAPLRLMSDVPALPPELLGTHLASNAAAPGVVEVFFTSLLGHPILLIAALAGLAIAGRALAWVWSFRPRWLTVLGLGVALVALVFHQLLVFATMIVLLLLLRLTDLRELFGARASPFHLAAFGLTAFWIGFGLTTNAWETGFSSWQGSTLARLGYALVGFPDVVDQVLEPWARAVPLLLASLVLLLAASAIHVLRDRDANPVEQLLLMVVVSMVFLVGIADAPRTETRYTFFLYPVLLVVAIGTILRLVEKPGRRLGAAPWLGTLAVIAWFVATEDFQPRHLRQIDSPEFTFREGMKAAVGAHYYRRGDTRAAAEWLQANATGSDDFVVSGPGIAALPFYFAPIDLVYMEPDDQRLFAWACKLGTVDRWSNLPLVYDVEKLKVQVKAHRRSFIVVTESRADRLMSDLAQFHPQTVWNNAYGGEVIVRIDLTAEPSPAEAGSGYLP